MTKDDWDNVGLIFHFLVASCVFAIALGLLIGFIRGLFHD